MPLCECVFLHLCRILSDGQAVGGEDEALPLCQEDSVWWPGCGRRAEVNQLFNLPRESNVIRGREGRGSTPPLMEVLRASRPLNLPGHSLTPPVGTWLACPPPYSLSLSHSLLLFPSPRHSSNKMLLLFSCTAELWRHWC